MTYCLLVSVEASSKSVKVVGCFLPVQCVGYPLLYSEPSLCSVFCILLVIYFILSVGWLPQTVLPYLRRQNERWFIGRSMNGGSFERRSVDFWENDRKLRFLGHNVRKLHFLRLVVPWSSDQLFSPIKSPFPSILELICRDQSQCTIHYSIQAGCFLLVKVFN